MLVYCIVVLFSLLFYSIPPSAPAALLCALSAIAAEHVRTRQKSFVFVAKQMCLLQALEAASEGRTVVKIAHRLNTIANADIIAVLHAGKVVEIGKPEQLLADPEGFFYNLFHNQKQQPSE